VEEDPIHALTMAAVSVTQNFTKRFHLSTMILPKLAFYGKVASIAILGKEETVI
jgi:hypothetical protein